MYQENDFEIHSLLTEEGVKIGYRKIGQGPGLILLHGGLQSSLNFTDLAKAMSGDFTIYIPDRRGRGLSDPYRNEDGLRTESSDLLALVRHSGAAYAFGLSSGAIIALQAALNSPALTKIALYEPPIPVNENTLKIFGRLDQEYEQYLQQDNLARAFICILKILGDTSFSLLRSLPAFITVPMVSLLMRTEARNKIRKEPALKDLVPTFHHDRIIGKESGHLLTQCVQVRADVLFLSGRKSQTFLKETIAELRAIIPNAKYIEFRKQGHIAADNSGDPKGVAARLVEFFKGE